MAITAREVGSPRDADAVCRALRHAMRWEEIGLARAPDESLLDDPTAVLWPSPATRRLHAVLLFAHGRLAALGTSYGWSEDTDRTRVAELTLLDGRVDGRSLAGALLAVLFTTALAVRARFGGRLATQLDDGPLVAAGGSQFRHLARDLDAAAVPDEPLPLDDATLAALGAHGPGWLDGAARTQPASPPFRVYDPSTAHGDLVRGSRALAPRFYPRIAEVEELDVAVVGGGIAGLTAAYALAPRTTLLFEREAALGGTARAGSGFTSRFPLGAHYECDPDERFAPELIDLYRGLGLVRPETDGRYAFVDAQHYVPPHDYEQSVLAGGATRRRGWKMFFADPDGARARDVLLSVGERFALPTRLAEPQARALDGITLAEWLAQRGVALPFDLRHGLDVLLRSDYAAPSATVSAYAGLHYFLCRPYLRQGSRTFSPPEGLAYFAERLFQRTPSLTVRAKHMVRHVEARPDHVLLDVLDLDARRLRRYRAAVVVYAAPKKALKYIHPPDAHLFAGNAYSPWLTVTFEMQPFRESAQLCWNNHVYDPRLEHIGFSWVNHRMPDAPPVLTHYIAFEPGRWQHLRALMLDPRALIERCIGHVAAIVGRDVSDLVRRVTIQKLGHAMAVPLPGKLFFDPNARRIAPRVVYAGVDTGRLPLLAEAFDSGLEAARLVKELVS